MTRKGAPETAHGTGSGFSVQGGNAATRLATTDFIQGFGALLVLDRESGRILALSENASRVLRLECPADAALGRPLSVVLPGLAREMAARPWPARAEAGRAMRYHALRARPRPMTGRPTLQAYVHEAGDADILEAIEIAPTAPDSRAEARRMARNAEAAIFGAADFRAACMAAADAARAVSGLSRCCVLRFHEDWSSEVVGESLDGRLASLDGLHFPHFDIAPEMRGLLARLPFRCVADIGAPEVPLRSAGKNGGCRPDLSCAMLRGVASTNRAYLAEMGVRASVSVGLTEGGRLWGLISGHAAAPIRPDPEAMWLLAGIGRALSERRGADEDRSRARARRRLHRVEAAAGAEAVDDPGAVLSRLLPGLARIMSATGCAYVHGQTVFRHGVTPPSATILALRDWLEAQEAAEGEDGEPRFSTTALYHHWPPARAHAESACGVLVQRLQGGQRGHLMWFRPPARDAVWAGSPSTSPADRARELRQTEGQAAERKGLHFAEVAAPAGRRPVATRQSAPWSQTERFIAEFTLADGLSAELFGALDRSLGAAMRDFARIAAHDLKAPLRGLGLALEAMEEGRFDPATLRRDHALALAQTRRMQCLTDGLAQIAGIGPDTMRIARVDLRAVVKAAAEMLEAEVRATGAVLDTTALPALRVDCDEAMMLRLFLNLLGNALKFARPGHPPRIDVARTEALEGWLAITVSDTGIGVAPEHAEQIFEPLRRGARAGGVEGSGLGLSICRQIMSCHGGTITLDTGWQDGARFRLCLPLRQPRVAGTA